MAARKCWTKSFNCRPRPGPAFSAKGEQDKIDGKRLMYGASVGFSNCPSRLIAQCNPNADRRIGGVTHTPILTLADGRRFFSFVEIFFFFSLDLMQPIASTCAVTWSLNCKAADTRRGNRSKLNFIQLPLKMRKYSFQHSRNIQTVWVDFISFKRIKFVH